MNNAALTAGRHCETAALEYPEHRHVFGQNLGNELRDALGTSDFYQVADQECGDALSLMRVFDGERHFGTTGLRGNVPCTADNGLPSHVGKDGHQSDVIGKVDVQEELDLALTEASF